MGWWWLVAFALAFGAAGFIGRKLIHGAIDNAGWFRRRQYVPWSGMYYEFGGIHLRAVELEDGSLVFLENDLLKVIGQSDSTTVKLFGPAERVKLQDSGDMALTQAGCERLLVKSPHAEAKKLLLFLQRECFKPHAKKRERVSA